MARTELFVNKQSGGMFAVESMGLGTGNRFYVDSGTGTDGAGYGRNPDSPTFTATAIAGDFKLAAASIRIENLLFLSGIDATTAVTGATFQMAGGSVYVGNLVNEQGMLSTWTVATNA